MLHYSALRNRLKFAAGRNLTRRLERGVVPNRPQRNMSGFIDFDAGHRDLVTVTKFNFYGNRIVTASSDHRMKVWDQRDDEWQLVDTWRAHDAEIRDVSKQTANPVFNAWFVLMLRL